MLTIKTFKGYCTNCNLMITKDEAECPGCGQNTEVTLAEMDPSKLPVKYDEKTSKKAKYD